MLIEICRFHSNIRQICLIHSAYFVMSSGSKRKLGQRTKEWGEEVVLNRPRHNVQGRPGGEHKLSLTAPSGKLENAFDMRAKTMQ